MTANEAVGRGREPKTAASVNVQERSSPSAATDGEWLSELSRSSSARATRHLQRLLQTELSHTLGLDVGTAVGLRERFIDLGLESLRAVEVRDVLEKKLLCKLNSTLLFDYPTVESLAEYLVREVLGLESPTVGEANLEESEVDSNNQAAEGGAYAGLSEEQLRLLLSRVERKLQQRERQAQMPIAVVGMACRLPVGIATPDQFWEFLKRQGDGITEVPKDRWDAEELYDPEPGVPGKVCTRSAGFITDIDKFDADLFGISPREAEQIDPQQRLLLEVSREALEDAGVPVGELHGSRTGVFVGMRGSEYHTACLGRAPEGMSPHTGTGGAPSAGAGRISYTFGLCGPSISIDTACSSSLVAVHQAVQSLRLGECDAALVASVNLLLDPLGMVALSQARMLSPHGRCRTFDASADGYVRAEGCIALLLKPLDLAEKAGDRIYAVVRGSAVNQDGASGGLTVPSGPAQEAVIRAALRAAQVQPYQVAYVEAHGTGTLLGDPIEVQALNNVFSADRYHGLPLFIGSVKTNIGHLEIAAGLAGLMKVVLALHKEAIVPQRALERPNPLIDWAAGVSEVLTEGHEWPRSDVERLAGISSFGFAGTNAHVVVAEAPQQSVHAGSASTTSDSEPRFRVLPVSAHTPAALKALLERYRDYFESDPQVSLADVCSAAALSREHLGCRRAFIVDSRESAQRAVASAAASDVTRKRRSSESQRVAFLFTGQGSQYPGMGKELYQRYSTFKQAIDACSAVMAAGLGCALPELMWGSRASDLNQTRYAQPAIFSVEYALSKWWESLGVLPDVVLGHSVGEFAAACSAGILSLKDAARLIAERGRLMSDGTRPGAMLSVSADLHQLRDAIGGQAIAIAAINGERSIVVSGGVREIEGLSQRLGERGVQVQRLQASHAFHSPLMEPIQEQFFRLAESMHFEAPGCTVVSSVTGSVVRTEMSDPRYWSRQIRETVRFSEAIETLAGIGSDLLIVEVGPNATLTSLARAHLGSSSSAVWATSLRPPRNELEQSLSAVGTVYEAGLKLDWRALYPGSRSQPHARIPTYPYERQRFWFAKQLPSPSREPSHELLGRQVPLAPFEDGLVVYEAIADFSAQEWLNDHRIGNEPLYPAMAYVVAAQMAARTELAEASVELCGLAIRAPLFLQDGGDRLQCTIKAQNDEWSFAFHSTPLATQNAPLAWTQHVQGKLRRTERGAGPQGAFDLASIRERCPESVEIESFYQELAAAGLIYGPSFRLITEMRRGGLTDREVLVAIALETDDPARAPGASDVRLLDSLVQGVFALLPKPERGRVFLPFSIERVRLEADFQSARLAHGVLKAGGPSAEIQIADVTLLAVDGRVVGRVDGISARAVNPAALQAARLDPSRISYHLEWLERPLMQQTTHESRGTWLLICDGSAADSKAVSRVGQDLAWDLEQSGSRAELVQAQSLLSGDDADVSALIAECPDDVCGVIFLAGLDEADSAEAFSSGERESHARAHRLLRAAILLVQRLRSRALPNLSELWLVTRGAQEVEPEAVQNPSQATLWGFGGTLALEWPELRTVLIDLDPNAPEHDARVLYRETAIPISEARLAYRGGRRFAARLTSGVQRTSKSSALELPDSEEFQLQIADYGSLANLSLAARARPTPAPDEVRLRPRAAGINFKDVLYTLGLLQSYSEAHNVTTSRQIRLGFEAAGVVDAVGENVTDIAPGQEVIALGEGLLGSTACVARSGVVRKPAHLSFEQAATLPTAFLTVMYGLEELARLSSDDTVLIHAAAGGVGQAALQIASRAGARVFATASRAKWGHLRAQGVLHVFDSRSLDFAEEIMRLTDGQGVSVVLNSLKGAFAESSLEVLGQGGRFVELGKIETLGSESVARRRPDVSYYEFDLGDVFREDPALQVRLLAELSRRLERAELEPLPLTRFELGDARSAFRYLAQGKNVGKVVLSLPESPDHRRPSAPIRPDSAYLISGGLGGLGLLTAEWLVAQGARTLALLSRRAPSETALAQIEQLRSQGAEVTVICADVADATAVERICNELDAGAGRLKGVVHAAGVVTDALIGGVEVDQLERSLAAKTQGAINLHRATLGMKLDFWLAYSSAAAQLGSEGQATYASANAFLDALCSFRRGLALPAMSINWGPWAEVGMAARLEPVIVARYAERGVTPLRPEMGLRALEFALRSNAPQLTILQLDWARYLGGFRGQPPTLLERFGKHQKERLVRRGKLAEELKTLDAEARRTRLTAFVLGEFARVSGLPGPDAVDTGRAFSEMGLDSLLALDFRNCLETELDCSLSPTLLFEHPNVVSVVEHLLVTLFARAREEFSK